MNGGTTPQFGFSRTPDGALHLVWQTQPGTGLSTAQISPAGKIAAPTTALTGWQAGIPGLVTLPNGTLEAVFGAISPTNVSSLWAIASSTGGATWSAPVDVRGGGPAEALAYGADVTAVLAGGTPVVTLPQAGNLVVQQGLGPGMPNIQVNDPKYGSLGGVNSAVDAVSGEVVASWQSLTADKDVIQAVAPTVGAPQIVPGQMKNTVELAGRDAGPGVYGAYAPDGRHVRLLRYGGGSVSVGSIAGATAKVLGVATGLDGRIWAMWGDEDHVAVTRSNKAVTRFEPIQQYDPRAASLWRLAGDGRLGPLDLIVAETPQGSTVPGAYAAHILPLLSAVYAKKALMTKQKKVYAFKVTFTVSDAGDPIAGAAVAIAGKKAKTNGSGVASVTLPAGTGKASAAVTAAGYRLLELKVEL